MTDIEGDVIALVAESVVEEFPDIFITSEEHRIPPRFPCLYIRESDNSSDMSTWSSGGEGCSNVMYTLDIYSAEGLSECREILKNVDRTMLGVGFGRMSSLPIPNGDESIKRMTARYVAKASGKTIYRR